MSDVRAHAVKDLVQARLLGAIFSHSLRDEIALKGGFAMRVMAGSVRYTKDIDLAASPAVPVRAVQSYVRKAIADLQGAGLVRNLQVSEPKQTDTTQRWKIGGMVGSSEIHLTVEVSRRDAVRPGSVAMASYSPGSLPPVPVACIDLPSLAAAKVGCLGSEVREAPRDVYDLFLLVSMDVKPSPQAIAEMGMEKLSALRDHLWDKLAKMDYAAAQRELVAFLPAEAAEALTEDAWDEMRLVVDERVRQWVNEAMSVSGIEGGDAGHDGLARPGV